MQTTVEHSEVHDKVNAPKARDEANSLKAAPMTNREYGAMTVALWCGLRCCRVLHFGGDLDDRRISLKECKPKSSIRRRKTKSMHPMREAKPTR